jgi:hypothetical protein
VLFLYNEVARRRTKADNPFSKGEATSNGCSFAVSASELIRKQAELEGNVRVNKKSVKTPNYICRARDILSLKTKQGIKKLSLKNFLK